MPSGSTGGGNGTRAALARRTSDFDVPASPCAAAVRDTSGRTRPVARKYPRKHERRTGGRDARDLLIANFETAARPVITRSSPIGAPVALWRELGRRDSRDAVVVEVLAEAAIEAGQQASRYRRRRQRDRHERRGLTTPWPRTQSRCRTAVHGFDVSAGSRVAIRAADLAQRGRRQAARRKSWPTVLLRDRIDHPRGRRLVRGLATLDHARPAPPGSGVAGVVADGPRTPRGLGSMFAFASAIGKRRTQGSRRDMGPIGQRRRPVHSTPRDGPLAGSGVRA